MSESSSGDSNEAVPAQAGFKITPADGAILQEYLEDFGPAQKPARTKIVERAMAQLYMLRAPDTPFDKVDVGMV